MRQYLILLCIGLLLLPAGAHARRLYSSGAEMQSATNGIEWLTSNGTMSISTTTKRSGVAATRHNPTTSTGYVRHTMLSTAADVCYGRFYIYIASYPDSDATILGFHDTAAATFTGTVEMTSTGILQVISGLDGSQRGSDSSALSLNTWYRVELAVDSSSAGSWNWQLRIDGTEIVNDSQASGGTADCDEVAYGASPYNAGTGAVGGPNETMDIYFDDIAVNEDINPPQITFPGAGSILHMQPDAAGDVAATAGLFSAIDEVTPNDATDYIEVDAIQAANYNFESWTEAGGSVYDTINYVTVGTRQHPETAAAFGWGVQLKSQSSGTATSGVTQSHNDTTWKTNGDSNANQNYHLDVVTDPQGGGGAWTPTLLDSAIAGVNVTDATPNGFFSTIWLLVEFIPGEAPAAGTAPPQDLIIF